MKPYALFLVILLSVLSSISSRALYMRPEINEVPLERLLNNLKEKVTAEPDNVVAVHQLARTEAMAYAKKMGDKDQVQSWRGWQGKDVAQPWFGFEPPHVPFHQLEKTNDADQLAKAKLHLAAAISHYKKAQALEPEDNAIRLGLAWCQDQAGDSAEAVKLYRAVLVKAWEEENKSGGGLGNFLYVETAGYLKPLLDAKKDETEIAEMEKRKEKLLSLPRAVTPIILPMGDTTDLASLVNHDARVRFDLDGSGRQLEWSWITKEAAWLVFDPSDSGHVSSAIQMFGSRSFLLFCSSGYEALSLLDDDQSGAISGDELKGLALWHDRNSNGVSDAGEVLPVIDHGIVSLSVRQERHESGIPYSREGVMFRDGSSRPTYDVILQSK